MSAMSALGSHGCTQVIVEDLNPAAESASVTTGQGGASATTGQGGASASVTTGQGGASASTGAAGATGGAGGEMPPACDPGSPVCDPGCAVGEICNHTCHCVIAPACGALGVDVTYAGGALPPEIAGHYDEAFDCVRAEGGAWSGGVDFAHCFRKADGSAWRIWNTGCGWEYGWAQDDPDSNDPADTDWLRYARTYSGYCAPIPEDQLSIEALTTSTFFDSAGDPISGLDSVYCGE
jgi:hypothetical protein